MTVGLRGLGVCSTYPDSIGYTDMFACAMYPWTDNCKRLKEQAELECAQYTGAISRPPMPPALRAPDGSLIPAPGPNVTGDPANAQISQQYADYQAAVAAWANQQVSVAESQVPNCGMFETLNPATGLCAFSLDVGLGQLTIPLLIIGGMVLLSVLKK